MESYICTQITTPFIVLYMAMQRGKTDRQEQEAAVAERDKKSLGVVIFVRKLIYVLSSNFVHLF